MVKIDHVSFSNSGGAGKVASTLQKSQILQGHDSILHSMIDKDLRREPFHSPMLTFAAAVDEGIVSSHTSSTLVSFARSSLATFDLSLVRPEAVVNLHWIEGLLGPPDIKSLVESGRRMAWTLHDMAPFTSVCHHSHDCHGYRDSCARCPQVRGVFRPAVERKLSSKILGSHFPNFAIVAPTKWLATRAKESTVFQNQRIETIPNPIDALFFEPSQLENSAKILAKFTAEDFVVCTVAADLSNSAKGVSSLVKTFQDLKSEACFDSAKLVLVGRGGSAFNNPGNGIHWLGELDSSMLAQIADQTDVLVSMSEAESAGLTVREFGARGVPSIVLDRGALSEMVIPDISGHVIEVGEELKALLLNYSRNPSQLIGMGRSAKNIARENRPDSVSGRYIDLYESLELGF
jgi:glycosyltransferase involved in cell wall biosynthesis